jgi:hypothetical protein
VKGEDVTRPESLTRKGVRVIKKDIFVYAFFLLLSFVLWYLNSLGKEMEAGIKYQVKFTNLPRERAINKEQPSELNLFLKGPGYSILKLKISGNKAPLIIDISKVNYRRSPGEKSLDYYIITSGLSKSLNVQLRSGCEITSIKPDTLFFTLVKVTKTSFVSEGKQDNRKSN